MPVTTRIEITDGQRVPNIREARDVDPCDFFLLTDRLLQRTSDEEADGEIMGYDVQVGAAVPVDAKAEVDVVEEIRLSYVND